MCHDEIAFCDDDRTELVVPALGILFHQGAQTGSLGRNKRVVLDVVGREPPFQRSEVAIGKGLSEEVAHDGFVAQRVVGHVCVLLRSRRSLVLKAGSEPQKSREWGWGWLFVPRPARRIAAGSGQRRMP